MSTLETEVQEERSKSSALHHMNVLGSDALEWGCHKWEKVTETFNTRKKPVSSSSVTAGSFLSSKNVKD